MSTARRVLLDSRKRALSIGLACGMLTIVAGLFFSQTEASAAGNLSSVVLTTTFPCLVLAPPGSSNGPRCASTRRLHGEAMKSSQ